MAKMLMGAFATPEQADRALYELEHFGYTPQEISVISKQNRYEAPARTTEAGAATADDTVTTPADAAVTGITTGGLIGGLAGLLAGIGIMPALAGLFIGGPIAAALGLAGAAATTLSGAVTGAAAGGLIGLLTGLGLSKETATAYDSTVNSGGVVLGLSGHEANIGEARAIMEKHGAQDISEINTRQRADATMPGAAPTTEATATTDRADYAPQRHEPAFGERTDLPDTRDASARDTRDTRDGSARDARDIADARDTRDDRPRTL